MKGFWYLWVKGLMEYETFVQGLNPHLFCAPQDENAGQCRPMIGWTGHIAKWLDLADLWAPPTSGQLW